MKENNELLSADKLEQIIYEMRSIAYMMVCISDSVTSNGVPSDKNVFSQTMYSLSSKLDGIADTLVEAR